VGVGVPPPVPDPPPAPEPLPTLGFVNVLPHPVRTIIDVTHKAIAVILNLRCMVCSP
jgi:hypothetical protein